MRIIRTQFTELSDSQWHVIKSCLPKQKPKKLYLRNVANAMLFISGLQERNLPSEYPK